MRLRPARRMAKALMTAYFLAGFPSCTLAASVAIRATACSKLVGRPCCLSARLALSQINQAQRLLSQLQERISGEEASSALNWFRVDIILESTSLTSNTKFYALQILESAIKYRWKTLPAEQASAAAHRLPRRLPPTLC